MIADLLSAARRALEFIEDEAENRSAAGSYYSDYEREPREIAEALSAAINAATGPLPPPSSVRSNG